MKLQVEKFQKSISWKCNAQCTDLDGLVQAAKMKLDAGQNATNLLMPKNNCFHSWAKFNYVHTCLYNRDRPEGAPKIGSIIRMVLHMDKAGLSVYYYLFRQWVSVYY